MDTRLTPTRGARISRVAPFVAALLAFVLAFTAETAFADVRVQTRFGHGGRWIGDAATPVEVVLENDASTPVQVRITLQLASLGSRGTYVVERDVPLGGGVARREAFLVPGPTNALPNAVLRIETSPTVPIHGAAKSGDRGFLEIELVGLQRSAMGVSTRDTRAVGVLFDPRSVVAERLAGTEVGRPPSRGGPRVRAQDRADFVALDEAVLRLAPLALDGIETLIVCDPDATFCSDPQHLDALLDWTALGGRLVVSLGDNAASFAGSPLAQHLPTRWTSGRGNYAELVDLLGRDSFDVPARDGPIASLEDTGRVERLVVERRFGAGAMAVAAMDVRRLVEITPRDDDVLRTVAEPFLVADGEKDPWPNESIAGWRSEFDVGGRVSRLIQQDAFRPPPLLLVLFALIAYVAVVGPLDWMVLKRLRKERYTTFTFGAAVLAFTVLAYGVSYLLFAADAVANRITFVTLAEAGRAGRADVVQVHDLVGFYAPSGGRRDLRLSMPGAMLATNLPGIESAGGLGADLPITIRGSDPLGGAGSLDVGFRSQRILHTALVGTTGRTLVVQRDPAGEGIEVTNTLPVDLIECWVFLPGGRVYPVGRVGSGGSANASTPIGVTALRWDEETAGVEDFRESRRQIAETEARRFLAHLAASTITSERPPTGHRALRRARIVHEPPPLGRALVVAVADETPFAVPGSDLPGTQYVVIAKEVDFR